MSAPTVTTRHIEIELIDEPALPMRETFDEAALIELEQSIRAIGLVEPIIVKPVGARFEVVAGHRRLIACRRNGMGQVRCEIRELDAEQTEAFKTAENVDREDVNPIEEAAYFAELYETLCGQDVDRVCEMVKRRRPYVEERLLLLRGAAEVQQALRDKKINLSVAKELNKFPDRAGALMHLEYALSGATAGQVKQWRANYVDMLRRNPHLEDGAAPPVTEISAAPAISAYHCQCCAENTNMHRLISVYVHDYCYEAVLKPLLKTVRGEK